MFSQYLKTNLPINNGASHAVKVYLSYDRGDSSGYRPTPRGYYLHVQPVWVSGGWEKCIPMNGYRAFLLSVQRSSQKAEREAENKAREIVGEILARVASAEGCTILDRVNLQ